MRRSVVVVAVVASLALAPLAVRALVPVIGDALAERFLRLAREGRPPAPLIAPDPDARDAGVE